MTPTKETRWLVADTIKNVEISGMEDDLRMLRDFEAKYDWPELVFEKNGHKGLRDILGNVLVPPVYDGFADLDRYMILHMKIAIAEKDGLYGIVSAKGKGTALSSFVYDEIQLLHKHGLFLVHKHGDALHSILDKYGRVLVPNMVEQIVECKMSRVVYKGGDKYGAVMINSDYVSGIYSAFEPVFDSIRDSGPDSFVEFGLDEEIGYLSEDQSHQFVTKEEYDSLEEDLTFYKTRWNEDEGVKCCS